MMPEEQVPPVAPPEVGSNAEAEKAQAEQAAKMGERLVTLQKMAAATATRPETLPEHQDVSTEDQLQHAYSALAKIADITKEDAEATTAGKANVTAMDVLKTTGKSPVFQAAGLPQAHGLADALALGEARYHDMRCHPGMILPYTTDPYQETGILVNGQEFPYRVLPDPAMPYSFDAEKGLAWGTFRMSNWS